MNLPCPVCKKKLFLMWSKKNFPLNQQPVPMEIIANTSYTMNLKLFFCPNCNHGVLHPFIDSTIMDEFYTENYSYYTSPLETNGLTSGLSEQALNFTITQVKSRWKKQKVKIAEVGGNDGYFLSKLSNYSSKLLLIEPGKFASDIAQKNNIPVCNCFLDEKLSYKFSNTFDVIICRHVLEHIDNPANFLKLLTNMLCQNGMLIIEVPNNELIIKNLLVRVVKLEHFHYFSPCSLSYCLKPMAAIISFINIENYAFIVSVIKKSDLNIRAQKIIPDPEISVLARSFTERLDKYFSKLNSLITNWTNEKKKIWIWGAGSAGGEMFNIYGQNVGYFSGYIDSDERKSEMRFLSAPDLPILSPEKAYEQGIDAIIIASMSVKEIRKSIKNLGWKNIEVNDLYSLAN